VKAVDLVVPGSIETLTGGYIYDRRILAGLVAQGWETHVVSLPESFPSPSPAELETAAATLAAIPRGRVVVIDGLALAGLVPALPAQRERLRLVALVHHPLAYETGLDEDRAAALHAAEQAALEQVEKVIVTSRWTREALADFGVAPQRIAVVEPGTERGELHTGGGGVPRLLCVASLTARKGHEVLLDALAELEDRRWHLYCAGSETREPDVAARIRGQIRALGLEERVTLLGEIAPERLAPHYAQADVFVLASHLEGYGMAFAEALAHGLPIVATQGGAVGGTVPTEAGLLVPTGDVDALAAALARVLDDPSELARLNVGAAAARTTLPSWAAAAARFARELESVLA
jgi:glycosyltransferase involved in cell wall biosynthesis